MRDPVAPELTNNQYPKSHPLPKTSITAATMKLPAALALFASLAAAQQVGTEQTETHPKMSWSRCTGSGSCSSVSAEVVIDANWRWLHNTDGYDNCYDGNEWVVSSSPPPSAILLFTSLPVPVLTPRAD